MARRSLTRHAATSRICLVLTDCYAIRRRPLTEGPSVSDLIALQGGWPISAPCSRFWTSTLYGAGIESFEPVSAHVRAPEIIISMLARTLREFSAAPSASAPIGIVPEPQVPAFALSHVAAADVRAIKICFDGITHRNVADGPPKRCTAKSAYSFRNSVTTGSASAIPQKSPQRIPHSI